MLLDKIHVEERQPEQAANRAIVIDYGTAKWIVGTLITIGTLLVSATWWTAATTGDLQGRTAIAEVNIRANADDIERLERDMNSDRIGAAGLKETVRNIDSMVNRIAEKVDAK